MIYERFQAVVRSHTNRLAIIDEGASLTYGELVDRVDALAVTLTRDVAVREAELILALLPNSADFVVLFLAAARLGAVLMPIDPALKDREVGGYLERFDVRAAVTSAAFIDERPEALTALAENQRFTIEALLGAAGERTSTRRGGPFAGVLAALSTSGSSGTPKVAGRTHRGLLAGVKASRGAIGVLEGDRVLGVVPFHHAHGLAAGVVFSLMTGGALVVMRRFHPRRLIEVVSERRVSVFVGSPFIFSTVADCVADRSAFSSVRSAISSGAAVPAPIAARFLEKTGVTIRELYGSTETGTIAIDGKPVESVEVTIVDDNGAAVELGAIGEVLVRSDIMSAGYLGEEDGGRLPLRDGFYPTGDLGHIDANGTLVLSGRRSLRLNIAGVKVDPVEIERVILDFPQVAQVAVSSVIGERGMEMIRARVVLRPHQELRREALIDHCRKELAEYKVPRIIEVVGTLHENIMGKRVIGG
jgi:long-chain acyl-CoA synthetase